MLVFVAPSTFLRWHLHTSRTCSVRISTTLRCHMSQSISRRRFGQLVTAASLLSLSATSSVDSARAFTSKPAFIKQENGISLYDTKTGSGSSPVDGDFVVIYYVSPYNRKAVLSDAEAYQNSLTYLPTKMAFLSSGKMFDNRKGFVFQMGRTQVIPGLEEAISTMKPSGQRRVVLPPALAYGSKCFCLPTENECLVPASETIGYSATLQRVAIPLT